jgi:hypothetical protein
MRRIMAGLILLLVSMQVAPVRGQSAKYPPHSEYMMTPEAEIALARSAAPENVSAHATVKILTASGFKVAAQGDNGFVCIVMRGWGAPTLLRYGAPHLSARGTSTLLNNALLSTHFRLADDSGINRFGQGCLPY